MIEIDPKVLDPDELVRRVRERLAVNDPEHKLEAAKTFRSNYSQKEKPNRDLVLLEQNVRFLHTNWENCDNRRVVAKRPMLRPVVSFVKKVCRKLLARQVEFNGAVTRSVSDLLRLMQAAFAKQSQTDEKVQELEARYERQNAELIEKIASLQSSLQTSLQTSLQKEFASVQENQAYFSRRLRKLQEGLSLQPAKAALAQQAAEATTPAAIASEGESCEFDYIMFENRYRGSRDDIKQRLAFYLPYFAKAIEAQQKIVDIGCGRGEMIELLLSKGANVIGVDLNQDMVEYCREKGLPAEYQDAIDFLQTVPDASLGAVFLAQVVEHMTYAQWAKMLNLIHHKLMPQGCVIVETINPKSFFALANAFYMDVSHVRPIHADTLSFAMESMGYQSVEKVFLSLHPATELVAEDSACENKEAVRALLREVFGNQDYAVIAYR